MCVWQLCMTCDPRLVLHRIINRINTYLFIFYTFNLEGVQWQLFGCHTVKHFIFLSVSLQQSRTVPADVRGLSQPASQCYGEARWRENTAMFCRADVVRWFSHCRRMAPECRMRPLDLSLLLLIPSCCQLSGALWPDWLTQRLILWRLSVDIAGPAPPLPWCSGDVVFSCQRLKCLVVYIDLLDCGV